ncbi:MAG TPA: DUF6491 family protein [Rhizomicrobium sp.]
MRTTILALLSGAILAAVCTGHASGQDVSSGACFRSRDMGEWKSPDPHTMYVSVNPDRTYKVTFNQPCAALSYMDARLITKFHGPDSVCGPADWDLQVADREGDREACIVNAMRLMSPAEVAAIPSKDRP